MKEGLSTAKQYKGKSMKMVTVFTKNSEGKVRGNLVPIPQTTILEARRQHMLRHPNDKNTPRKNKGVIWGKKTEKDKELDLFYKQHIYTFVDENDLSKKQWVRISGFEGDDE